MKYALIETITRDNIVRGQRVVCGPVSLETAQERMTRMGHEVQCPTGKEVEHHTWIDSRLRTNETTLCIHRIK